MVRTFPGIGGDDSTDSDSTDTTETDRTAEKDRTSSPVDDTSDKTAIKDDDTVDRTAGDGDDGASGNAGIGIGDSISGGGGSGFDDDTDTSDSSDVPARGRETETGGRVDEDPPETDADAPDTSEDIDPDRIRGETGDGTVDTEPDDGVDTRDRITRTFDDPQSTTDPSDPQDQLDVSPDVDVQTEDIEQPTVFTDPDALEQGYDIDATDESELRSQLRQQTASRYTEATASGLGFSPSDIEIQETDQGFRPVLNESAQSEIESYADEQYRTAFSEQVSEDIRRDYNVYTDPDQINIQRTDDGYTFSLPGTVTEELTRREAAQELEQQYPNVDADITDITFEDGQINITGETQRQITASQYNQQFETDIATEDVAAYEPNTRLNPTAADEEGFVLTPEAKEDIIRDQAFEQFQQQTETDINRPEVTIEEGQPQLTESALKRELATQFTDEDITVTTGQEEPEEQPTGVGLVPFADSLTEDEQTQDSVTVDTGDFERGEEFVVEETEDGLQPTLTTAGEQQVKAEVIASQRDISPERVQFDGTDVTGIQEKEPDFDIIRERIGEFPGSGALETALIESYKTVDTVGDVSEDASRAFSEEIAEPAGETVTEAAASLPGGVTVGDDETPLAAQAAGGITEGVLQTGSIALGAGDFIETTSDVAGRGAAFAVEEGIDESVEATTETTEEFATQTVEQIAKNPFVTTGTLIGTAGIMGAAGKISPRAGVASRYAIQPGEEILGRVGQRVTPGRAADVLFPRGEPIFASEEAAIRGAQLTASGAKRGAQRVRQSIGEITPNVETEITSSVDAPRVDVNIGQVDTPGAGLAQDIAEFGRKAERRLRDIERPTVESVPGVSTSIRLEARDTATEVQSTQQEIDEPGTSPELDATEMEGVEVSRDIDLITPDSARRVAERARNLRDTIQETKLSDLSPVKQTEQITNIEQAAPKFVDLESGEVHDATVTKVETDTQRTLRDFAISDRIPSLTRPSRPELGVRTRTKSFLSDLKEGEIAGREIPSPGRPFKLNTGYETVASTESGRIERQTEEVAPGEAESVEQLVNSTSNRVRKFIEGLEEGEIGSYELPEQRPLFEVQQRQTASVTTELEGEPEAEISQTLTEEEIVPREARAIESLRDLGIRIDVGKPTGETTGFETPSEAESEEAREIEDDWAKIAEEEIIVDTEGGEVEQVSTTEATDTGVVRERVFETESTAETETETEPSQRRRIRAERPALDPVISDTFTQPTTDLGFGAETTQATTPELDVEGVQRAGVEAATAQEVGLESAQEYEFESETSQELAYEQELETEVEAEAELEAELEIEGEPFVPEEEDPRRDRRRPPFEQEEDIYGTGIADVEDVSGDITADVEESLTDVTDEF